MEVTHVHMMTVWLRLLGNLIHQEMGYSVLFLSHDYVAIAEWYLLHLLIGGVRGS